MHVGEPEVATLVLERQLGVSDPQAAQDGCLKVVNVNRVTGDVVAVVVCLSQGHAGSHAAKGALGKSKLDGKEEDIRMLLGKEVSKASIAKILDVSRSALYHFIETRNIAPG